MDDWAAQYEDDPALRESKAQQEAAGIYEWRREGLDITKGNTQRFAEAHSSLREAVAEFYVLNGGMLALPSLAELVVAGRNTSCGSAVWMGLDGGICLASNAISLWLWSKREVLQDRELHKYILRSARGDAEPNEALQRRSEDFNKAISRATAAMLGSMATSLVLWIVGLGLLLFKDLSHCPEVRTWIRFMIWIRALMPMVVVCCVIPIQQMCCEASCFASLFALHGLAEIADRHDQESSVSETESSVSTTW